MEYLKKHFILPLAAVIFVVLILVTWSSELITADGMLKFQRRLTEISEPQRYDDINAVLRQKVKLLCWIMTGPKTINIKARAINQTWGRHCDVTLYISSAPNEDPPATVVNVREGRRHLTEKSKAGFELIYRQYYHNYDWFLKADDDSFVIVDNLLYLLAHFDPRLPLHFGHQFYSHRDKESYKRSESWDSGGAGYVLSREALKLLVTEGFTSLNKCPYEVSEDFYIGQCLERLNIVQGLSADNHGRPSFLPLSPRFLVSEDGRQIPRWYKEYSVHAGSNTRFGCCSPLTISFHYVQPEDMYLLYLVMYKIGRFGHPAWSTSLVNSLYSDPQIKPLADDIYSLPDPQRLREMETNP